MSLSQTHQILHVVSYTCDLCHVEFVGEPAAQVRDAMANAREAAVAAGWIFGYACFCSRACEASAVRFEQRETVPRLDWKPIDGAGLAEDDRVLVWTYYGPVMAKIFGGRWHRWPDGKRMDTAPTYYVRVTGPEGQGF